jgi:hypothetical protein
VRVKQDVELMVIPKEDYKRALGDVVQKQSFLTKHLPGLKKLAYRSVHPATYFQQKDFGEGTVLVNEGVMAIEPAIYVVHKGELELRRFRNPSDNPAYVLGNRPLVEASWRNLCEPPAPGIAGSGQKEKHPPGLEGEEVVDVIGPGGIFCPIAFLPLTCAEPFTVVVASETCQVFRASGIEIEGMPPLILKATRKRAMRDLARRFGELPSGGFFSDEDDEESESAMPSDGRKSAVPSDGRPSSRGASRITSRVPSRVTSRLPSRVTSRAPSQGLPSPGRSTGVLSPGRSTLAPSRGSVDETAKRSSVSFNLRPGSSRRPTPLQIPR